MATYNSAQIDPATGEPLSAIRWLLQDLPFDDGASELTAEIADEEILTLYAGQPSDCTQEARVYRTAAACAQALHRRYAKQASFSSDGTSVQLGERARYWASVVNELATTRSLVERGAEALVVYAGRDTNF